MAESKRSLPRNKLAAMYKLCKGGHLLLACWLWTQLKRRLFAYLAYNSSSMVGILRQVDRAAPVTPHCPPLAPEVVAARQDYTIKEQGFQDLNGRPMRVIGIGAGASGIVSVEISNGLRVVFLSPAQT